MTTSHSHSRRRHSRHHSPSPVPTADAAPAPKPVLLVSAFDPPSEIIKSVVVDGAAKGSLPVIRSFLLAWLAGVFVAIGGSCSIAVGKGMESYYYGPGIAKFAFGAVFPVGFLIAIIAGGELVTTNFATLIPAVLNHKIKWWLIPINWATVYCGNFIGSLCVAFFWCYLTDFYVDSPYLTGVQDLAEEKTESGFGAMFLSATGCNFLVAIAVFMALAAKTLVCKAIVIWFPIQTFATIGFEHCVANMFLVPVGILYGANISFGTFVVKNLIPVTLGNIVGGGVFVACFYWYLYSLPEGWPFDQQKSADIAEDKKKATDVEMA